MVCYGTHTEECPNDLPMTKKTRCSAATPNASIDWTVQIKFIFVENCSLASQKRVQHLI